MPRYRWDVTVPPTTTEDSAVTKTIDIDERELVSGLVFAPPGSAARVNAEVLWGETRVLPSPNSSPTVLPDTTDPAPLDFRIRGSPYELTLRAWAPTAVRSHTVTARVDARAIDDAPQDVRVVGTGRASAASQRRVTPEDIMNADE